MLTGHLDKEKLADYYANADVFLHPNPREPFGNVVLEAMASGVPIVVPDAGGVLSYADEKNAWLAAANAESFAAAISEAVHNQTLRRQKIENALKIVQTHTAEQSTDLLFATYDAMFADFQQRRDFFAYHDISKADNFTELYYNDLPAH